MAVCQKGTMSINAGDHGSVDVDPEWDDETWSEES